MDAENAAVVQRRDLQPAHLEVLHGAEVTREPGNDLGLAAIFQLLTGPVLIAGHVPDDLRVPRRRERIHVEPLKALEGAADNAGPRGGVRPGVAGVDLDPADRAR